MELGILHNSPPSTKRGCRAGRLHRLWHGLPPAPWPCTRSQHHSMPSRNLHPLMVPPFLQPHPDLQSAVGNAPLSSKHPAQLPTTDCLLSIISPMGGQPSDAPALSPPSPLQQGGQSSNTPALSPPSPLPQGGQPIALALSPPSPPPQGGQPSDAPGLSPSSSTLLLCPSDSTLNICHLNSQSAVKTGTALAVVIGALLSVGLECLKCYNATLGQCKLSCQRFSPLKRLLSSVAHSVDLLVAYLLMLIVMTFNVYIFIAVIMGAGLGHFLFRPVFFYYVSSRQNRRRQSILNTLNCPTEDARDECAGSSGLVEVEDNVQKMESFGGLVKISEEETVVNTASESL
ncbi:hypothetical protein ACOMHN_013474 [Nucella lapillus]